MAVVILSGRAERELRRAGVETTLGNWVVWFGAAGICRLDRAGEGLDRLDESLPGEWAEAIRQAAAGREIKGDVPVVPAGTDFQLKVWSALVAIPCGKSFTYGEVAHQIRVPAAARAVGSACGKNPVPLLIPCHRVVGAGGKMGGYSLGITLKQRLLEAEQTCGIGSPGTPANTWQILKL